MKAFQSRSKKIYFGRLGAYGQVRTKQASKADPNSFLTYLVYQRYIGGGTGWFGPFSLPYFNYRFAGWEFDRDGKQLNFINSPVITVPMRLSGKLAGELQPGLTFPNMTFQLGTEFVAAARSPRSRTGTRAGSSARRSRPGMHRRNRASIRSSSPPLIRSGSRRRRKYSMTTGLRPLSPPPARRVMRRRCWAPRRVIPSIPS